VNFYRLSIAPNESEGEGLDCSEWFTSLMAAKRRRAELIAAWMPNGANAGESHHLGCDYAIDRYVLARGMKRRDLILAILNRTGWAEHVPETVVPEWTQPEFCCREFQTGSGVHGELCEHYEDDSL
jgi:hypothetical protein